MGRYASQTEVPVERSRAEIEECLKRYGATSFTSGWDEGTALIAFRIKWKTVRGSAQRCSENQQHNLWEQEVRQRWRALLLVVKAKLEAVECGISSLEREFMAFIVLPNDQTLGEWVAKNALDAIRAGKMPLALEAKKEDVPDAEMVKA